MIEQLNSVFMGDSGFHITVNVLRTPQAELSSSSLGLCVFMYLSIHSKTFVQFVYIPDTMQGFEDGKQSKEANESDRVILCNFFFLTFTFCRDLPDFFLLENKKYIAQKILVENTKLKGTKHHFYLQKVN